MRGSRLCSRRLSGAPGGSRRVDGCGACPSTSYEFTLNPDVYDADAVRFFDEVARALNDLARVGRVRLEEPAAEPSPKTNRLGRTL